MLGLLLFVPAQAKAAVFHPQTFTLANGLQVVVVQNRLSPAVNQMVWYKVGSADEKSGHSGLAHYLEHMMFRGTDNIPPGAFSNIIAEQGGNDNAFTSYDYTAYYENVAADRLPMIMQMEADRMQNLRLTPEVAAPELSVVLSERQERTDNKPEGKFNEKTRAALFPDHPYGRPVIGHKAELEKITADDARDFYEHHYAPNNAVVIISGNVELSEVVRLAAGTYGRLPPRDAPKRKALPKPTEPRQKHVIMADARVQQPYMAIHTLAPSYATAKGNEAYALEVLDEALAGGEVGLLYRDLVVKQKIASGVDISYDPQERGPSDFAIVAVPQPGVGIHDLEKALNSALHRLAKKGVSARDVEAAKGRQKRIAIFARDSLTAPGHVFGQALTTGQTVGDVEAWPERIGRVTASDVNAALRALVASRYRVTGMLLPGPAEALP